VNGLTTSQKWNCDGGLLASETDANGNSTTYGYIDVTGAADPLWRVLSRADPVGNTVWTKYSPGSQYPQTVESTFTFNGGASTADVLKTFDGIGRTIYAQKRQAPGASTFDSVQYTYGWNSIGLVTTQSMPYSAAASTGAPPITVRRTGQTRERARRWKWDREPKLPFE
jgi:YD repeat-containing protein